MRFSFIALFLLPLSVAIASPKFRISFGSSSRKVSKHKPSVHSSSTSSHYPISHGKSGNTNSGHGHHRTSGTHYYPPSTAKPIHTYNGARETTHQQHVIHHYSQSPRTEVHHYYHYRPPQRITYGYTSHPVFQGQPPVYVYNYRNSGSRFDNLLTGLALYNLGRNSNFHHYGPERRYSSPPGEMCKLRISMGPTDYEETRIDCNLVSSFIWDDMPSTKRDEQQVVMNTTQVTVTQTVNGTGNSSVTTVTMTNSTVEDALNVKGPSIQVRPGMTCSMIRTIRDTTVMRRTVDCGLLQEYARKSLERSVAQCLTPVKTIVFNFLIIFLVRY